MGRNPNLGHDTFDFGSQKILNISLHNYFHVITFCASVFFGYFFELYGVETS